MAVAQKIVIEEAICPSKGNYRDPHCILSKAMYKANGGLISIATQL